MKKYFRAEVILLLLDSSDRKEHIIYDCHRLIKFEENGNTLYIYVYKWSVQ